MGELKEGLRGEQELIVGREDLASVMGNIGAEVLSTHRLVLLMEMAARSAVESRLPEGTITVGTFIQIKHYAATPLGLAVRAEAHLRKIDGRRLTFDVAAYDEFETIAEGQNEQLIVSKAKFLVRTKRKTLGRMTAKNRENSP
jgi:fluoroacetyl-CoA thioesterase